MEVEGEVETNLGSVVLELYSQDGEPSREVKQLGHNGLLSNLIYSKEGVERGKGNIKRFSVFRMNGE